MSDSCDSTKPANQDAEKIMSDSCDSTKPANHDKEIDRTLAVYTNSHRSVARYTLILKANFTVKAPFRVIRTGMSFVGAYEECEQLNKARLITGFAAQVYGLKLENPEEALQAVRIAADRYWADHHAHAENKLATA